MRNLGRPRIHIRHAKNDCTMYEMTAHMIVTLNHELWYCTRIALLP